LITFFLKHSLYCYLAFFSTTGFKRLLLSDLISLLIIDESEEESDLGSATISLGLGSITLDTSVILDDKATEDATSTLT